MLFQMEADEAPDAAESCSRSRRVRLSDEEPEEAWGKEERWGVRYW